MNSDTKTYNHGENTMNNNFIPGNFGENIMNNSILDSSIASKYNDKASRWLDKGDHYELILMGSIKPVLLSNIIMDMVAGDKSKEVHVFVSITDDDMNYLFDIFMQQLLTYEYRVGIFLGGYHNYNYISELALILTSQECYIPYEYTWKFPSFAVCYIEKWQNQFAALKYIVDKAKLSSEFTPAQLIELGFAKNYNEYTKREIRCR